VKEWKDHPVTKKFFEFLEGDRERIKETVISGDYTAESAEGTAQLLAQEVGKAKAIQSIIEYAVEDLVEEAIKDEEDDD